MILLKPRLFYKFCILFSVLFLFSEEIYADFVFTENCKKAYTEITSLRFQKANQFLLAEKKENPTNDFPYLLENYIDFLVLSIGEESKEFELRKGNKDIRMNRILHGTSNSPYYLYAQAEIHLLWAMARLKFGEYLTAANETKKAYNLLVLNSKRYPHFLPNKNALGQMHCIIGTIPSNFRWAVKMVGMEGTMKQGIAELNEVLSIASSNPEYHYLWPETAFFMTFFELNLHKDEAIINDLYLAIKSKNEKSPLISFCLASIAMKTGKSAEAIQVLSQREKGPDYFPFYYLDFLQGLARLNHLEPSASEYLVSYVTHFKGKNYIKSAYQKLAWAEFIKGNVPGFRAYMEKVKSQGYTDADEDKQALKEAETGLLPNLKLLKSRLLCDGGYYKEALSSIIEKYDTDDFITLRDQIEFPYRLGRIYHLWKKPDQAIGYYKLAIEKGRKSRYYFAANAALQLGLIYEAKGDRTNAKKYFEECQELPTDEYRNSLDAKAKAGLERLN
ncbi:MAG: hypothetical protein K1X82_11730 [Bacteroidia bacterium]|nr:hypothetical protein [Bacteroidia bacterium]